MSCAALPPKIKAIDTYCSAYKPLRVTNAQIDVLVVNRQKLGDLIKKIAANEITYQQLCGVKK